MMSINDDGVYLIDGTRGDWRLWRRLAHTRPDDMAATIIRGLLQRHPAAEAKLDEVVLGCANQAGEDNRNVARMAALLSGLDPSVPAITPNRLCASGLDAVIHAAAKIPQRPSELILAGGVESMSRALCAEQGRHAVRQGGEAVATPRWMALLTCGWRSATAAIRSASRRGKRGSNGSTSLARGAGSFALASQQRGPPGDRQRRLAQNHARGRAGGSARPRVHSRRMSSRASARCSCRRETGVLRRRFGHGGQRFRASTTAPPRCCLASGCPLKRQGWQPAGGDRRQRGRRR
ncbi:hypothetical protein M8494_15625 [Serratia ureilytica]